MPDEDPDIVDSVTEATDGIGSEALAAISNLGGGSGSIAAGVVSRIGATITGQAGGFAPKAIITITKHGLAAIDRVEPIQGVDRGYRAVARDANGLESIHTVLDLDPREYDVTVTREDGVAIVEFVQQDPEPEAALPPGEEESDSAAANTGTPEPMAPVKDAGAADRRNESAAPAPSTNRAAPLDTDGSGHLPHAPSQSVPAPAGRPGTEVERARAEAEKAKAQAEAEKARAEAERAKAEAEAAKARAEAERVKAEADTEAVRSRRQTTEEASRPLEQGDSRSVDQSEAATAANSERDRQRTETERTEIRQTETPETEAERTGRGRTASDTSFSASRDLETEFDAGHRDTGETNETAGSWGLREGTDTADAAEGSSTNASGGDCGTGGEGETDGGEDGFGGFTPATPVEDEPPEYADGGTIETSISVHDEGQQDAVADGGTESEEEDTGKFEFGQF